jgi:integral membrane protein
MGPLRLFRTVAVAEAVTWALLLVGMFLKYVTETTDVAVSVFGMVHGVVFIAYVLVAVLVAVDQRWSTGRTVLALLAAVPPFLTVLFDVLAERRGAFAPTWRLTAADTGGPSGGLDRPVGWLLRHPGRGALAGAGAVLVLTAVALAVGPPVG